MVHKGKGVCVKNTARSTGEICSSLRVLQEDVFRQKTNLLKKSRHLLGFVCIWKKPNWVPLNLLMAEHLRAQWDILLLFLDILTKYFTVLSNLSRQHHSAVTQFGFFKIQTNVGFLSKDLFFCQKMSPWSNVNEEQISPADRAVYIPTYGPSPDIL